MLQDLLQSVQVVNFRLHLGQLAFSQTLYLFALGFSKRQQIIDFFQSESQFLGAFDEQDPRQGSFWVTSVSLCWFWRLLDKLATFVITDGFDTDLCCLRQFTDGQLTHHFLR